MRYGNKWSMVHQASQLAVHLFLAKEWLSLTILLSVALPQTGVPKNSFALASCKLHDVARIPRRCLPAFSPSGVHDMLRHTLATSFSLAALFWLAPMAKA